MLPVIAYYPTALFLMSKILLSHFFMLCPTFFMNNFKFKLANVPLCDQKSHYCCYFEVGMYARMYHHVIWNASETWHQSENFMIRFYTIMIHPYLCLHAS